jgi:putative hydrolase of the HAD superfamily
MLAQSKPHGSTLDFARRLAASGAAVLFALNNESRELNEHRIEAFGLREIFTAFLSSCYLGVAKPSSRIFRLALDLVQTEPESCVFVDDREVNLEAARRTGIRTFHYRNLAGLRADLERVGVRLPTAPGNTTKNRSRTWKSE